jgi:hypothetical protein
MSRIYKNNHRCTQVNTENPSTLTGEGLSRPCVLERGLGEGEKNLPNINCKVIPAEAGIQVLRVAPLRLEI